MLESVDILSHGDIVLQHEPVYLSVVTMVTMVTARCAYTYLHCGRVFAMPVCDTFSSHPNADYCNHVWMRLAGTV